MPRKDEFYQTHLGTHSSNTITPRQEESVRRLVEKSKLDEEQRAEVLVALGFKA